MLGLFLEFLLIIFIVSVGANYLYPELINSWARTFNVDPMWKSFLLATIQKTLCFDAIGKTSLDILTLSLGDPLVVSLWFISGLIFGFRHKHIKDSVILGFVTPLAVAQFYIMMLQQYLPNMWSSFSPDFQQKITYLSYFNGFQIGLILTIALVVSTIINKVRTRKPKEVYTIPEEALAPLEIRCPSCGAIHYSNAIYCSYCGAVMSDTRVEAQTRSGD